MEARTASKGFAREPQTAEQATRKMERYQWTVVDKQGQLVWLDVENLKIDDDYQRKTIDSKILGIAKAWSWIAAGTITVARRDKVLYVIDGQHRVAAAKRCGIPQLPCVVFNTSDNQEEANGFLASNTRRKPITSLDRYKALVVAGDETALFLRELIESSGRVVSERGNSGATTVACFSTLLHAAKADRETLARLWPLICDVTAGNTMHVSIVEGLLYIETHLPEKGDSLIAKKWRERVIRCGHSGLLKAAQGAAAFYARGGARVWAMGMVEAMNKGCRHRLSISSEE